jgi:hypothetical protein
MVIPYRVILKLITPKGEVGASKQAVRPASIPFDINTPISGAIMPQMAGLQKSTGIKKPHGFRVWVTLTV